MGPFNLNLSLEVGAAFSPDRAAPASSLKAAVAIRGAATVIEIEQSSLTPPVLQVSTPGRRETKETRRTAEWLALAELDLTPFYEQSMAHPVLGPIIRQLWGLKHLRPATVFEMAIIAVTEQQISLAAAYRIRQRVVERFGKNLDGMWLFPGPADLSRASLEDLVSCGLSGRKAEYIRDFATAVMEGRVDIEGIRNADNEEVRELVGRQRGFGRWSADYILIRGLGRPDVVPADDLGIRTIIGRYLGNGARMSAGDVERALAPFSPYRGLATFYFLAHSRLRI